VRCFVAIELPEEVKSGVGRLQATLREAAPRADVHWTAPAGLHVTLQFLGEVRGVHVPAVCDALTQAGARHAPKPLEVATVDAFPTPSRPRVIVAGIAGDLAGLVADVGSALAPVGYPPETRPFRAHVTLGRVRRPGPLGPLTGAIAGLGRARPGAWTATEVVLFRSHLRPTGSVYEPLARVPLLAPCP
jgi:2'-5' RNA ligase